MRRREFITLLGGAAAAWPVLVRAQQPERMRRVGVLLAQAESDPESQERVAVVRSTLQKLGWIEARSVHLDLRWFANDPERAKRLARELVELAPDAILVQSTPGIEAVREATRTIPTVFVVVANPVGNGLVTSLARPGANVTGFSTFEAEIGSKWLELLKEAAPQTQQVAVLGDPDISPFADIWRVVEAAAPTLGLQLTRAPIHTVSEIEPAIATVARTPNRLPRDS